MRRLLLLSLLLAALAVVAAGCGGDDDDGDSAAGTTTSADTTGAENCAKDQLDLTSAGKLTIGTDNPAFPPWFDGGSPKGSKWEINDPSKGQGFEGAVAYAVAKKMGFAKNEVEWVVVPFDQSFKPGPKSFDFDINQISIKPGRAKNVDFSEPYYDVNQALVALKGSTLANAKTLAAVKDAKLGAQIGTTSLTYIQDEIEPSKDPSVYNTNNDVISALKAKQIDGIVVDLPTAFYVTAVQVPAGTIVGQFPDAGEQEQFGLVLAKDSPLTACVDKAVTALRDDGTLDQIQQKWLADKANAPVLE
ncbi:MAG: ABC transporter substrate-binding protein [Gaiellaceae bacterium]